MKNFLFVLMLLFVGSLLAIESDQSNVVGYIDYDLIAGNNTIALPMSQGYALASEVGDAVGASTVGYFNQSTQLWQIIYNSPFGGWNADFPVSNGQALWITVESAIRFSAEFCSIGGLPENEATYALVAGNNMIMLPLNKSSLSSAALVGDSIGASALGFFNSSTQLWQIVYADSFGEWGSDFATFIGDPLLVSKDNAGTWPSRAIPAMSSKSLRD